MERCNPAKMKETATTASTAARRRPRPRPRPLGAAALGPFFFLGDGAAVEINLPLKTAAKGRNFRGTFDLGFLSLYRLSDSHHPDYVFSILGLEGASELRLGRILGLNPPEKNYLQLCSFKFFRLRLSFGVSEVIFKTCLVGTDFGRVRVQLLQGSLL